MPKELKTWNKLPTFGKWIVVLALLVPAFSFAQTNEDGEELEELEAFVMTGSRIKRLDIETVNPVLQLTSDSIEEAGFSTVGDALRALPLNSGQSLVPADAGTSFTPGISTVNLRGLGNNNTLMLINGRRIAPYAASGFNGFQSMFDLNSIPAGAIDAIEILKDGASAIYGSDAVSGVVNVVLKKDYQGVNTKFRIGNYADADAFEYSGSIVVGDSTANTSFVTAVSYDFKDAMPASELGYTSNVNRGVIDPKIPSFQSKANVRAVYDDRDLLATELEANGRSIEWLEESFLGVENWYDYRSSRGFPGYFKFDGKNYTSDTSTPRTKEDDMYVGTNPYNYQATNGFISEQKNLSWYTRIDHTFTDSLYGFAELSFSRAESQSRSAGATLDIESSKGLTESDSMYVPAYNPYNVFGVDITNGRRRFVEMGNRVNDVTSDTPRVLVGLGGDLANDWTWETGLLYTKNSVSNISFAGVDYKLQQALMGLAVNSDGSLSWDSSTPLNERRYFNWFGLNGIEMVDFITVKNPNYDDSKLFQWDASVAGTIVEMPAGPLQMAAGLEARRESINSIKTDLNATGMILGGGEGTGFGGQREVQSAYVEFSIPLLDQLEMQVAGRFETYSDDGFEEKIRPKVALKYRPTDWLVLRASYNESFKAPDLKYLYASSTTTFSSFQYVDPVTGTKIDQIQTKVGGNTTLGPEVTDSYYAGAVVDFGGVWDKLEGLTFSVDYFQLDQSNVLAQLSDFYGYNEFFTGAAEGNPLFSDKVVRSPESGEVLYLRDVYENLSETNYKGWDFKLAYNWETDNLGEFGVRFDATYLQSYEVADGTEGDMDNIANTRLRPNLRANTLINWTRGDWEASMFVQYIKGRQVNDWSANLAGFGLPVSDNNVTIVYDVDDQFVYNPRVTYTGWFDSRITFGVNNVFNDNPPADPQESTGATVGVNYIKPMFWYLSFEKEF